MYRNFFTVNSDYDFLKKLVKEACLAPLFFTSTCVFLLVVLTGDGRFSFTEGSVTVSHHRWHLLTRSPKLSL